MANFSLFNIAKVEAKANMALNIAKSVASKQNVEYKSHEILGSLNPDTSGEVVFLSGIAQGDSQIQRNGAQCKAVSLNVKYYITKHASASNTIVRIIFFIDSETDATLPTIAELLGTSVSVTSFKNETWKRRFIILKDITHNLGDKTCVDVQWYKKLKMVMKYSGDANTIDVAVDNHLFMAVISTEATYTPSLYYRTKIKYLDN